MSGLALGGSFAQSSPLMIQGGIEGGLDDGFRFRPYAQPLWIPAFAGMTVVVQRSIRRVNWWLFTVPHPMAAPVPLTPALSPDGERGISLPPCRPAGLVRGDCCGFIGVRVGGLFSLLSVSGIGRPSRIRRGQRMRP